MKKACSLVFGGLLTMSAVMPSAAMAEGSYFFKDSSDGIVYRYSVDPDGETATIISVLIPDDVTEASVPEEMNGYRITAIAGKAYIGSFYLKKIVIPPHIESIGTQAFMSCNELEEVVIGDGITAIPDDCFFSCPKLAAVELPDSLLSIGSEAFFGCDELDITVPPSVTDIGYNAIGMKADSQSSDTIPVRGFLIKGTAGSRAEAYANENGIDFIDPDNFLAGDVNNDGVVDASDASDVLTEYAGTSTGSPVMFTKKQLITGDMNMDGFVDSTDASQILTVYAENSTA